MTHDNWPATNDISMCHWSLANCHMSFKTSFPQINLLLARPNDALILFRDWPESFVNEFLNTLAAIGFARIDVSFRIDGNAMNAVEFAGLAAAFAECGQDLQ